MAQAADQFVAAFERAARTRRGTEPAWMTRARADALNRFLSLGFPTLRDEEWRFTSVAPIAETIFAAEPPASPRLAAADLLPFHLGAAPGPRLVFVNGRYAPEHSTPGPLPQGVRVEPLASSLAEGGEAMEPCLTRIAPFEQHAFTALNTALVEDGALIWVPAHAIVEAPIQVLFVSIPGDDGGAMMTHPRLLIVLGDDSQARIVETYVGPGVGRYFTNAVTEVLVGEQAVLDHYRLQHESLAADHIGTMQVHALRGASASSHSISFGGALVRNDVTAVLAGEGVDCTLNGLYLAGGQRHVDNHTTIDHAQPHCGSREIYKGILAERARGVFNGKIIVRPDAQKTDAKQTNRALLLSEDARINTKPQLEIFANDVRCTHGATVGQLDDEAVFYLRSRGVGLGAARRLLIHAFAADVLNLMPFEPVRALTEKVLVRQLSEALAA